jgi:hypothetical protein
MSLHRREDATRMPNPRLWVAFALVFAAAGALGADARSTEPSLVKVGQAPLDWSSPGPPAKTCNGRSGSPVKVYESRTMCGGPGRDTLTVPKDAAIAVYGLSGNDKIIARGPVTLYGGAGKDRADVTSERLASCWADTEKVYDAQNKRLQCSGRALHGRPTDFDPSKVPITEVRPRPPSVKCGKYTTGDWFVRFAEEPLLRAFNSIRGKVEFQKVAFAGGLYKWDAAQSAWMTYRSPVWLWDETHDLDWPPLDLDFWRTFTALDRFKMSFTLTPAEPGYYRAVVAYHWYPAVQSYRGQTVNVPAYDIEPAWVTDHFGLSNDRTARYSKDSYCIFGVDPAGGP